MICLVKKDSIVYGPAAWEVQRIKSRLFVLGYVSRAGVLHSPDGEALAMSNAEPIEPVELAGARILPVVVLPADPSEGQIVVGYEDVLLADQLERRPVYADAPPLPEPEPESVTWPPIEFLDRFTQAEQDVFAKAALADTDVFLLWQKCMGAGLIDPKSERVQAGMELLVNKELITEARKTEILTP
jgi:hypothetical protein